MCLIIGVVTSLEQNCIFKMMKIPGNSYDDISKEYFVCQIDNFKFVLENATVTTNTASNQKSNSEVEMVVYAQQNVVKFIPTSIFLVFVNLQYFFIHPNQHFELLKPFYLENAKSLKVFEVINNDITVLLENSFIKANNLEHINLSGNKITDVHKMAFKGLSNLKTLNLQGNNIQSLHPSTFALLYKVEVIDLLDNTCIDKKYTNSSFSEISAEIVKKCEFESTLHDVLEVMVEKERLNSQKFKIIFSSLFKMSLAINKTEVLVKPFLKEKEKPAMDLRIDVIEAPESVNLNDFMVQLTNSNNLIEKLNKKVDKLEGNLKKVEDEGNNSRNNFKIKLEVLSHDHKSLAESFKSNEQRISEKMFELEEKYNKSLMVIQNEALIKLNDLKLISEQFTTKLIQEKTQSLQNNFEKALSQLSIKMNDKLNETRKTSQLELISDSYFNNSLTFLGDKIHKSSETFKIDLLNVEKKCSDYYLVLLQNMQDQKKSIKNEIDLQISEKVDSFDLKIKTFDDMITELKTKIYDDSHKLNERIEMLESSLNKIEND